MVISILPSSFYYQGRMGNTFVSLFLSLLVLQLSVKCQSQLVPALYIFGDSAVEAGNSLYLNTSFRANFDPYGIDFIAGQSGRFSNGDSITDILGKSRSISWGFEVKRRSSFQWGFKRLSNLWSLRNKSKIKPTELLSDIGKLYFLTRILFLNVSSNGTRVGPPISPIQWHQYYRVPLQQQPSFQLCVRTGRHFTGDRRGNGKKIYRFMALVQWLCPWHGKIINMLGTRICLFM